MHYCYYYYSYYYYYFTDMTITIDYIYYIYYTKWKSEILCIPLFATKDITLYHIILYYIILHYIVLYIIVLHSTSNTIICTVLHFLMFLLELKLFVF